MEWLHSRWRQHSLVSPLCWHFLPGRITELTALDVGCYRIFGTSDTWHEYLFTAIWKQTWLFHFWVIVTQSNFATVSFWELGGNNICKGKSCCYKWLGCHFQLTCLLNLIWRVFNWSKLVTFLSSFIMWQVLSFMIPNRENPHIETWRGKEQQLPK